MGSIEPYETSAGRRYKVQFRKPDQSTTTKRGFPTKRAAQLFLAQAELTSQADLDRRPGVAGHGR